MSHPTSPTANIPRQQVKPVNEIGDLPDPLSDELGTNATPGEWRLRRVDKFEWFSNAIAESRSASLVNSAVELVLKAGGQPYCDVTGAVKLRRPEIEGAS